VRAGCRTLDKERGGSSGYVSWCICRPVFLIAALKRPWFRSPSMRPFKPHPRKTAGRSFEFALDALPVNAMFCDRNLVLRYLNRSSRKTLLTLQQYLPMPVEKLVGNSIHIFHKSPANIDALLVRGIPSELISCRTMPPSNSGPSNSISRLRP